MSYGDFTYTPVANITVIAECWGAGGGGRIGQSGGPWEGPGGGGGGYSRKAGIALTGGVGYLVRVGAPGLIAAPHESLFGAPVCKANGGANAGFQDTGAAGGSTTGAIGDVNFSGGNGSAYPGDGPHFGGGGGSSAGRNSNGNNGAVNPGGSDPGCGGKGGDGSIGGSGGQAGIAPGGGGGGGDTTFVSGGNADGAEGCVILWQDLGVWPPIGQTPIYTAGTLPGCHFPPVKAHLYAWIT